MTRETYLTLEQADQLLWPCLLLAAVTAAFWLTCLFLYAVRTRSRHVEPRSAGLEFGGPETPAVVSYITSGEFTAGLTVSPDAVAATAMDLTARGFLAVERTAPGRFTFAVREGKGVLTRYEEQVLAVVRRHGGTGPVPFEALTIGSEFAAQSWFRYFATAVADEARAAGLAMRRVPRGVRVAFGVATTIPAALATLSAAAFLRLHPGSGTSSRGHVEDGAVVVFVVVIGLLLMTLRWLRQDRRTAAGDEVAARWLGLRENLARNEAFEELPPNGVVMWDRYVGFAVVFGIARTILHLLPLGAERDSVVWSNAIGEWRELRVDRGTRFSGKPPYKVAGLGLGYTLFGLMAGSGSVFIANAMLGVEASADDPIGSQLRYVGYVFAAVAVFAVMLGLIGLWLLLRGVFDLGRRRVIEGVVARARGVFVVIDEAKPGKDVAVGLTIDPTRPVLGGVVTEGARVRAEVSPTLHYVRALTITPRATATSTQQ